MSHPKKFFNILIYAAIHIITDSTEHYNLLILINDVDDIEEVKKQLTELIGESPAYWSDYYVTTNNVVNDEKIENIIESLISESYS